MLDSVKYQDWMTYCPKKLNCRATGKLKIKKTWAKIMQTLIKRLITMLVAEKSNFQNKETHQGYTGKFHNEKGINSPQN